MLQVVYIETLAGQMWPVAIEMDFESTIVGQINQKGWFCGILEL